MILDLNDRQECTDFEAELVVIGAGPAGIVTALEAARRGVDVIIVESGRAAFDADAQGLSDAAHWNLDLHAPMALAVRRQIGGTSTIWGGRCVPYDPIDFVTRDYVPGAQWPVTYDDLARYFQRACDWMKCGRAAFNLAEFPSLPEAMVPGLVDGDVVASNLERWSLPTDFGQVYLDELRGSPHVRVLSALTCISIVSPSGSTRASHLECKTLSGQAVTVRAGEIVVACGGLESTRLLLQSEAPAGGALGNESDHLGRWYMGHLEGVIANVEFSTDPRSTVYQYERDDDGVYVRRRFNFSADFQQQQGLPNISAWLANPELADASHGNGELSFVYLALTSPLGSKLAPDAQRLSLSGVRVPGAPYGLSEHSPKREHVRNMLAHPIRTARFIAGFGAKRFLARGRKVPGFFVYNARNVYPLQYHGEHLPAWDSRVTLSDEVDALGMRKLDIDLQFTEADYEGVVRSHEQWDAYLRSAGVGRLRYLSADPLQDVRGRAGGGFHQVGTTRMSASPADGVVDQNLRVHGIDNVHVVSSSVFVTSGQANSTFMVVAFAARLADHLCEALGRSVQTVSSTT